nr:MAG TPA: hypothetical protein [Caudoviricetes sp.]
MREADRLKLEQAAVLQLSINLLREGRVILVTRVGHILCHLRCGSVARRRPRSGLTRHDARVVCPELLCHLGAEAVDGKLNLGKVARLKGGVESVNDALRLRRDILHKLCIGIFPAGHLFDLLHVAVGHCVKTRNVGINNGLRIACLFKRFQRLCTERSICVILSGESIKVDAVFCELRLDLLLSRLLFLKILFEVLCLLNRLLRLLGRRVLACLRLRNAHVLFLCLHNNTGTGLLDSNIHRCFLCLLIFLVGILFCHISYLLSLLLLLLHCLGNKLLCHLHLHRLLLFLLNLLLRLDNRGRIKSECSCNLRQYLVLLDSCLERLRKDLGIANEGVKFGKVMSPPQCFDSCGDGRLYTS